MDMVDGYNKIQDKQRKTGIAYLTFKLLMDVYTGKTKFYNNYSVYPIGLNKTILEPTFNMPRDIVKIVQCN